MAEVADIVSEGSHAEYVRAVEALNELQSTPEVIESRRNKQCLATPELLEQKKEEKRGDEHSEKKLQHIIECLEECGIIVSDLDKLNAIHVTGTKGKGSVCAMSESILRQYGLKTGLYTSPHVQEVRERIRINGKPLSKEKFVNYFWECYNNLKKSQVKMPTYFKFLTIMSFHTFLKEQVEVAVVEVGVGGLRDCTNVMQHPVVCAVSSIGYDHMAALGDTLEKIAWQKGGIFKQGHPVFTVPQFPGLLKVLKERACERKASSIYVSPALECYSPQVTLGLAGVHQFYNASLAAQVCQSWLLQMGRLKGVTDLKSSESYQEVPLALSFPLTKEFRVGLESCKWPGRAQILKKGQITYYLDGAHTPQSLKACAEWFLMECNKEDNGSGKKAVRVLLFNVTKKRDPAVLMQPLLDCGFSYVGFSSNMAFAEGANSGDQTNLTTSLETQLARPKVNQQAWLDITSRHIKFEDLLSASKEKRCDLTTSAPDPVSLCEPKVKISDESFFPEENTRTFCCVHDFVLWCEQDIALNVKKTGIKDSDEILDELFERKSSKSTEDEFEVKVLVTGSLHLVGAAMNALGCSVDNP